MRKFTLIGFCLLTATPVTATLRLPLVKPNELKHQTILKGEQWLVPLRFQHAVEARDPDAIWREIKSLAEAEVASDLSLSGQASFSVRMIGSTAQLTIKRGDIDDLGFGDDPYGISFKHQLRIESLRRALATAQLTKFVKTIGVPKGQSSAKSGLSPTNAESGNPDDQWKCYLDQAELLVKQTVLAIETITNKQQLNQYLQKTANEIDELIYIKLLESIERYAQRNGMNVVTDRGGPTPVRVAINTEPRGATVWIMPHLRYQQQLRILKTDPSQWPWRELVQNPSEFVTKSRYRYLARWPDGRKAEGNIEIKDASPVTFRPQ